MKITALVSMMGLCLGLASPSQAEPSFKTVHEFEFAEGILPIDELVLGPDGRMYGTAFHGGAEDGWGTVFRLHRSGAVDTLFSFGASDSTMVNPRGLMAASDGFLYGVVQGGGDRGFGGVYRISTRGKVKQLIDFTFKSCTAPKARLVEASDGQFYGSTNAGGKFFGGCLFRMSPRGDLEVLRVLRDSDGLFPETPMTQARDGHLYGVLPYAGRGEGGTIFRLTLAGEFSVVHAFEDPFRPHSNLVEGPDGMLYGTSWESGANGFGSVYRFDPASGEVVVLHDFDGATEGSTAGNLSLGRDGWLYGATREGGPHDGGVLYRVSLDGTLEVLHAMQPGKKEGHSAGLLEVSDGVFFGVANDGGVQHWGSAFRLGVR